MTASFHSSILGARRGLYMDRKDENKEGKERKLEEDKSKESSLEGAGQGGPWWAIMVR